MALRVKQMLRGNSSILLQGLYIVLYIIPILAPNPVVMQVVKKRACSQNTYPLPTALYII